MKKFRPTHCIAFVIPEETEEVTKGGIIIPDHVREKLNHAVEIGTLASHGEGFYAELPGPIPKVGDKVFFSKYAGALFKQKDDKGNLKAYRIINDEDIKAIVEEE